MQLGTFRDPEVLYEEEPEGRSNAQSVRLHSQELILNRTTGTTAFTGLKKVSVRALRALVKNTPHEFVFDHPDDNERSGCQPRVGIALSSQSAFGLACPPKRARRRLRARSR